MEKYDGNNLTPLFYSETSSSYIIYEIFGHHKDIVKDFLKRYINLDIDIDNLEIKREWNCQGKSIDLLIKSHDKNKSIYVLLEVKVHDYSSTKTGQIVAYYNAVKEVTDNADIYFIYLTQYNKNNYNLSDNVIMPPTINEYEESVKIINNNKLIHINWEQFHKFIEPYKIKFSTEERLMLELQEMWIMAKDKKDKEKNTVIESDRDFLYYFDNIDINIEKELPGKMIKQKTRTVWRVNLSDCKHEELEKVKNLIIKYTNSNKIDKTAIEDTDQETHIGIKEFFKSMAQEEAEWNLLSFYTGLFHFVNNTKYLLLAGTGKEGFSIRVNVKDKGKISLCTFLCKNKTIDFSLRR